MLSKLEYVELTYDSTGKGQEIICHYANGKTTKHVWRLANADMYSINSNRYDTNYYILYSRDCLDGGFAHIFTAEKL